MPANLTFPTTARSKKNRISIRSLHLLIRVSIVLALALLAWLYKRVLSEQTSSKNVLGNSTPTDQQPRTRASNVAPTTNKKKYPHLSCPDLIARSKKDDFYDPNRGMPESPKRHTITTPPFWISLHKEWFDQMRWTSIMKKGNYYETGLTDIFKEILTTTTTTGDADKTMPKGLVLDIGMNIGWFTLWSRALGHSVAAFEPNPVMHVRVCESLALNGWDADDSVRMYPYGLANEERVMQLTTGKNPGMSSFYEDRLAKANRKAISVDVVRLDSIAEQEGWIDGSGGDGLPIHLMKVDVEGYENFVVMGGAKLIQSGRATNIILENSVIEEAPVVAFLDLLYQSGYRVHALLSVNGDILDKVPVDEVNSQIGLIPSREPGFVFNEENSGAVHYLIYHILNMWWVKT